MEPEFLYNKRLLEDVDVTKFGDMCGTSEIALPLIKKNFIIRPLSVNDYNAGFLTILGQLTAVGNISEQSFIDRFKAMKDSGDTYYVTVIEDLNKRLVVATGTLIIEQKFIHECATRGRIEDLVVNIEYRGHHFGKIIVKILESLAMKLKCYKLTLECRDNMVTFYRSLGFKKEPGNSNYMQIRFHH